MWWRFISRSSDLWSDLKVAEIIICQSLQTLETLDVKQMEILSPVMDHIAWSVTWFELIKCGCWKRLEALVLKCTSTKLCFTSRAWTLDDLRSRSTEGCQRAPSCMICSWHCDVAFPSAFRLEKSAGVCFSTAIYLWSALCPTRSPLQSLGVRVGWLEPCALAKICVHHITCIVQNHLTVHELDRQCAWNEIRLILFTSRLWFLFHLRNKYSWLDFGAIFMPEYMD